MEAICVIKDIYKTLYQFEKAFSDVHEITINEAMLLCCLKDNQPKSAGTICEYIGLSNSRVSKVITSVENKGFIDRTMSKEDKPADVLFSYPERKRKSTENDECRITFRRPVRKTATMHGKGIIPFFAYLFSIRKYV